MSASAAVLDELSQWLPSLLWQIGVAAVPPVSPLEDTGVAAEHVKGPEETLGKAVA